MKKALYIIIAVLSLASTVSIMAKGGEELAQKMYVFGVSTSFNDSTVFFTEIMELEGAWVESKTGFIVSRDNYSYQLRDHLASKGYPKRTCIFISGKNLKDVTKKYDKLKSRYVKKGGSDILLIDKSEFTFKPIAAIQGTSQETQVETPKSKDKKKREKQNKAPAGK